MLRVQDKAVRGASRFLPQPFTLNCPWCFKGLDLGVFLSKSDNRSIPLVDITVTLRSKTGRPEITQGMQAGQLRHLEQELEVSLNPLMKRRALTPLVSESSTFHTKSQCRRHPFSDLGRDLGDPVVNTEDFDGLEYPHKAFSVRAS